MASGIPVELTVRNTFDAWKAAGVTLSKELVRLDAELDALRFVDTRPPGLPDVEITEANAEQVVRDRAQQLLPTLSVDARSAMERARKEIETDRVRRALHALAAAAPDAVDQLAPEFDAAAARYADAVNRLPVGVTTEQIVNGGDADVLGALNDAKRAAADLAVFDSFVTGLSDLPGVGRMAQPPVRLIRPTTPKVFYDMADAHQKGGRSMSGVERQLNPLWLTAARDGVEFRLQTPRESRELVDALEDERVRSYAGTGTTPRGAAITYA
ncbi:hypothetical protein [Gordonia tangerina]|uniref:Phage protein n=1 Tax=Gordonia tangerina TaxID=2911060 RepID=A0ABS9DH92_9ACTN|nr:hypothetical protein [Gordonia tangerina]MCF3938381.1 hypothetical protein [Gordonia tangerina]